jgi:hypothetical protein
VVVGQPHQILDRAAQQFPVGRLAGGRDPLQAGHRRTGLDGVAAPAERVVERLAQPGEARRLRQGADQVAG